MKETNLPETQLNSWQPRRLSARLKRRIFSARTGAPIVAWFLGPLAPVTACGLITFLIFHSGNGLSSGPIITKSARLIVCNQDSAAYADDFHKGQNSLSGFTFEWTNGAFSNSSIRLTPFIKSTN
jgi:hypothetical protein